MIYLDNQATTACDPRVIDAMTHELHHYVGNPSSVHEPGKSASGRVETARSKIAEIVAGQPSEIVLTSGATESNNLAILGLGTGKLAAGPRKKIVTTEIEHKSVLAPIHHLKEKGWIVEYLPLNSDGSIELKQAAKIINQDVALVSVQLANSEIGTIQPVERIAEMAGSAGAVFHCDAAQAVGKIPVDVAMLNVDLLSFSAHKLYGPQGIGALWVRPGFDKLISPLFYGGGNNLLRPGTIPVALVIGFGVACDLVRQDIENDLQHSLTLRNKFEHLLKASIPEIHINGGVSRLPNNSNITFAGVDADAMLTHMDDVIASTGSACESGSIEPSRVLTAIGLTDDAAYSTIRFGFGRFTTEKDVDKAVSKIIKIYENLAESFQ